MALHGLTLFKLNFEVGVGVQIPLITRKTKRP